MSAPRVTTAPKVVAVAESSPADLSGLRPGDELLSLNGRSPRDVIEYSLLVDEPDLDLVVHRRGQDEPITLRVAKEPGEPLGAEVASAVFDRVRTCDNHCEFCFIHQLPKGMRRSLSLKDDDYRLSFLYGNFTTLTRFTEMDLERVLTERLSPLFVSIHATDPDIRADMLRNRRGATSLRWLQALLDGGIEVHGQVVVCPDRNDGAVLHDTLAGVLDRYPALATVACVPLGVSRFSHESAMRPHTRAEAAAVCDTVAEWQDTFLAAIGTRMVFAADEYYLMAGRPFPPARPTRDSHSTRTASAWPGPSRPHSVATSGAALGVRPGFFAAVDGAPATGYRAPRAGPVGIAGGGRFPDRHPDRRVWRAGARPADRLPGPGRHPAGAGHQPLLRGQHRGLGPAHRYGSGRPCWRSLPHGHRYLLPDSCLSEGRFLDDLTIADLPRTVEVVPTDGVSLRRALEVGRVGAAPWAAVRQPQRRPGSGHPGVTSMNAATAEAVVTRLRPLVVIAGRPNVGKSTLVNRIVGRRAAVVEERPGVTRDRLELDAEWSGHRFTVVDTGGWLSSDDPLDAQVTAQAERAIAEAAVVLLVVDVVVGVIDEDMAVARVLKRSGRPVRVVVNKVDSSQREVDAWDAMGLGLGTPWPISALHGRGTGDLLDDVVSLLPASYPAGATTSPMEETGDGDDREAVVSGGDQPDRELGAEGRPGRSTQRGQVDAVQPSGRRRALGDPRCTRYHP